LLSAMAFSEGLCAEIAVKAKAWLIPRKLNGL
jgi:hypothetical protein